MKRLSIVLALIVLLILPGTVLARGYSPSGGYSLSGGAPVIGWWTLGSGGGRIASGGMTLKGTIGQAVIGASGDATSDLCAGFRCGAGGVFSVYLPVLLKAYP